MNRWWSGFVTGAAAATVIWVVIGGSASRAEIFARVGAGGGYVLDVRLDESALGRAVNIPASTIGEATLSKRSWLLFTDYAFTLRLRPDVTPESSAVLQGLEVSVRLPGAPRETNAARVTAGTAIWQTLGPEPLRLRTRAVHWVRIGVIGVGAAFIIAFGRRSVATGVNHWSVTSRHPR